MRPYRFVLFRPFQFIPVLFGISIITFILVRLIPGDPARILLGTRATPTAIANIRAQYGLEWLCRANPCRDSSRESSMVAGRHEQTHTPELQDQELAGLQ